MAAFRKFEDIIAWQKARHSTRLVYQITSASAFSADYDLRNQIRRASVSIMANIAEGFGRHSDKEFANFINIAHGSATEVQSHLYVASDMGYVGKEDFEKLYDLMGEICRMLYALRQKLS
jgi:four helix bundle protein